jgi:hypothetical protein
MARKIKTIAVLFVSVLVVTMGCANVSEALSPCAKDCMPVCLKEDGATRDSCGKACEDYCKQVSGDGGNGGFPIFKQHS